MISIHSLFDEAAEQYEQKIAIEIMKISIHTVS